MVYLSHFYYIFSDVWVLMFLIPILLCIALFASAVIVQEDFKPTSILVTINMYSLSHWDNFGDTLEHYRSICEGGWNIKVFILTAAKFSTRLKNWIARNSYCNRIDKIIPIEIIEFDKEIGNRIVDYSRIPAAQNLQNFDVFYYGEEDMMLTLPLLNTWVAETKSLKKTLRNKHMRDVRRCGLRYNCTYSIGFVRYWKKEDYSNRDVQMIEEKYFDAIAENAEAYTRKRSSVPNVHEPLSITKPTMSSKPSKIATKSEVKNTPQLTSVANKSRSGLTLWQDPYVYDQNRLEEVPSMDRICIAGRPYLSMRTSPHQASWILSRSDIMTLNNSCGFLTMSWNKTWKNQGFVREYMSSYSIYSNPYLTRPPVNCMVNKVIPAGKLELLKIRHFHASQVAKANVPSVYEYEERSLRNETDTPHTSRDNNNDEDKFPRCWRQFVLKEF